MSDGFVSTFSGNNVRKVTDLSEEERKNILIDLDARMDQDLGGIEANQTAKITLAAEDHYHNNRHIAEQWSLLEKELGDSSISDYTPDDRRRVLSLVVSQAMSQGGLDYLPSDLNDEVRVLASVLTDNNSKFKQISMDETVTRLSEALDGMDGDISFVAALKYAAKSTRNQKTDSGFGDVNFPWETTSSILGGLLGAGHALASTALAYAEDEKYATMVKSRWETHQQTNITPLIKSITDWYGLNKWKYGSSGDGSIKMPPPAAIKNLSMIMLQDIDPAMGRQNTAQAYGLRVAMIRSYHTQLHNEDKDKDARASVAMGLIEAVREFGELPKGIDFTNLPTDADGLIKLGQRITTALSKKLPAIESAVREWTNPQYEYQSNMLRIFKKAFPDTKTLDGKAIDTWEEYRKFIRDVAWNQGKYSKQDGLTMMTLFNASHKAFVGLIPKAGQVNEHDKRMERQNQYFINEANGISRRDMTAADNPYNLVLGASTSVLNGMYDGKYTPQYEQAYRNIDNEFLSNVFKLGSGTPLLKKEDGTDMTEAELKASASLRHFGFIREGGGLNTEAFEAANVVSKSAFVMTMLSIQERTGEVPAVDLLINSLKNSIMLPDAKVMSRGGSPEDLHQFFQTLGLYKTLLIGQATAGDVNPLQMEYELMEELGLDRPDVEFMKLLIGHAEKHGHLRGLMSDDTSEKDLDPEVTTQAFREITQTIILQLQDAMRNTSDSMFAIDSRNYIQTMSTMEHVFSSVKGDDIQAYNAKMADKKSIFHKGTYTNGQVTSNKLQEYGIHIPYNTPEDMDKIIEQMKLNNILYKNINYENMDKLDVVLGGLAILDNTHRNYLLGAGRLNDNQEGIQIDLLEILQMSSFALPNNEARIVDNTGQSFQVIGHLENAPSPDNTTEVFDEEMNMNLNDNPWDSVTPMPERDRGWEDIQITVDIGGVGRVSPNTGLGTIDSDPEAVENWESYNRRVMTNSINNLVQNPETKDGTPGEILLGGLEVDPELWAESIQTALDSINNPETGWVEGQFKKNEGETPGFWENAWNFVGFGITSNVPRHPWHGYYAQQYLAPTDSEYTLTANRSDVLMTAVYHYMKEKGEERIGSMSLVDIAANIESHNGVFYGRDNVVKSRDGNDGRVRLRYLLPGMNATVGFDIGLPYIPETRADIRQRGKNEWEAEQEGKKNEKKKTPARNLRGSMLRETISPEK